MTETTVEQQERRKAGAQSLRLQSLSPSFTVDDIDRSMKFYVEGLGFTVEERWEEEGKLLGVMLVAGNSRIGLSQDDWAKGRNRTKGVGFHVWGETKQDLDALASRIRTAGFEADGPKEQWGTVGVTVTDPDGYRLTIAAAKG